VLFRSVVRERGPARASAPWLELGLEPGAFGLVTLHRPALTDDDHLLRAAAEALADLSAEWPIVFPAHPRTRLRIDELGLRSLLEGSRVAVVPPLGYLQFLGLEAAARFVLTDSGGIQEEASALGVPCFTLRDTTERPVTVELGTNTLLGLEPGRIADIPALLGAQRPAGEIPLWDGKAGERCAAVLAEFLAGRRAAVATA